MGFTDVQNSNSGSNFVLVVIVSIVCINLLLIYKVVVEARKKTRSSNRAKHLVVILQALGDIFLALFPLSIIHQSLLDDPEMVNISCERRILAHTYLFYFMPFVHATSIIVLTAESFFFWRQQGLSNRPLHFDWTWCSPKSLLVSFLPWLLGVVTVGPLVLVGFDFETCVASNYSKPRLQSFYWITIILPGSLAFITACAYMLSSMRRVSLKFTLFVDFPYARTPCHFENDLLSYREAIQTSTGNMKISVDNLGYNTRVNFSEKVSGFSRMKQQCAGYGKECDTSFIDTKLQEKDALLMRDDGYETSRSPVQIDDTSTTIVWEKRYRLALAILFCVCSMPSAALELMFASGYILWSDFARVLILETLYRLLVLRSLISPLVWINEYGQT